jgi:arylsulfatase A-like enzyme
VNNEQTPNLQSEIPSFGIYEDKPWTISSKGHAAMISYLDMIVGKIRDKLRQEGLDKNTIIVFTADNGPLMEGGVDPVFFNSGGGLRGHKRDVYEGGIRVPLVVEWPGHTPGGVADPTPTASWDFLPTFAELSGSKEKVRTDGVSLVGDLLHRDPPSNRPPLFWVVYEQGFKQAVRVGDWKAIWFSHGNRLELYNLATDPKEEHDLAAAQPEIAKKMRDTLQRCWSPPGDDAPNKNSVGA